VRFEGVELTVHGSRFTVHGSRLTAQSAAALQKRLEGRATGGETSGRGRESDSTPPAPAGISGTEPLKGARPLALRDGSRSAVETCWRHTRYLTIETYNTKVNRK
jgi:hypothetical protein